jgi:hypothetical protein
MEKKVQKIGVKLGNVGIEKEGGQKKRECLT